MTLCDKSESPSLGISVLVFLELCIVDFFVSTSNSYRSGKGYNETLPPLRYECIINLEYFFTMIYKYRF